MPPPTTPSSSPAITVRWSRRACPGCPLGSTRWTQVTTGTLCLLPTEAVSEGLEASLFEWKERREETSDQAEKDKPESETCSVAFQIREETGNGWRELGAHTRLVNRKGIHWSGHFPPDDANAEILLGHLLRFHKP